VQTKSSQTGKAAAPSPTRDDVSAGSLDEATATAAAAAGEAAPISELSRRLAREWDFAD